MIRLQWSLIDSLYSYHSFHTLIFLKYLNWFVHSNIKNLDLILIIQLQLKFHILCVSLFSLYWWKLIHIADWVNTTLSQLYILWGKYLWLIFFHWRTVAVFIIFHFNIIIIILLSIFIQVISLLILLVFTNFL